MNEATWSSLRPGQKIICREEGSLYADHNIKYGTVVTVRTSDGRVSISDCPFHNYTCTSYFGAFRYWAVFLDEKPLTQEEIDKSVGIDKSLDFNTLDKLF